ncbi:unnamed protein product [Nesidiocoris tenuis]|uniref:Uncharacterized protein n=1 Tax=Nesidiocoris tenuis TaxID=355587 RepID=A0A6H5HAQ0_9HEMI|nr:unnamed protein product [Nesidiocoris tenuis]
MSKSSTAILRDIYCSPQSSSVVWKRKSLLKKVLLTNDGLKSKVINPMAKERKGRESFEIRTSRHSFERGPGPRRSVVQIIIDMFVYNSSRERGPWDDHNTSIYSVNMEVKKKTLKMQIYREYSTLLIDTFKGHHARSGMSRPSWMVLRAEFLRHCTPKPVHLCDQEKIIGTS